MPNSQEKQSNFPMPDGIPSGESALGFALMRVMHTIMFDDKPLPEFDALPLAQLRLLWTVHHYSGATMKEFSEHLNVSQSTLTQIADRLIRRGLAERKADENDRRIVRLTLSPAGWQIVKVAEAERRETLHAVWNALDDQQRADVIHGLQLLGDAAQSVRTAQGRTMPPMPPVLQEVTHDQPPVLDLMSRRIRGKNTN